LRKGYIKLVFSYEYCVEKFGKMTFGLTSPPEETIAGNIPQKWSTPKYWNRI